MEIQRRLLEFFYEEKSIEEISRLLSDFVKARLQTTNNRYLGLNNKKIQKFNDTLVSLVILVVHV